MKNSGFLHRLELVWFRLARELMETRASHPPNTPESRTRNLLFCYLKTHTRPSLAETRPSLGETRPSLSRKRWGQNQTRVRLSKTRPSISDSLFLFTRTISSLLSRIHSRLEFPFDFPNGPTLPS